MTLVHVPGRTRFDDRGRLHMMPIYSKIQRHRGQLMLGYPWHPTWYPWQEHIRGCYECVAAAVEDQVCDVGLALLNAFYMATGCRWETRPGREDNAAWWHALKAMPGLT